MNAATPAINAVNTEPLSEDKLQHLYSLKVVRTIKPRNTPPTRGNTGQQPPPAA